jgi:hypothetical protein
MAVVTILHVVDQVLIEQQVAVVRPVCEIVNDHDGRRHVAHRSLPAPIQCVVVDYQPVRRLTAEQRRQAGRSVSPLSSWEPRSVRRPIGNLSGDTLRQGQQLVTGGDYTISEHT